MIRLPPLGPDGLLTWTAATVPVSSLGSGTGDDAGFFGVAHSGTGYAAVTFRGYTVVSADGSTWTAGPQMNIGGVRGLAFGNGRFVAVGGNTDPNNFVAWSSNDGTSWTEVANTTPGQFYTIMYDGANFYIGGNNGNIYTSSNGAAWATAGNTIFFGIDSIASSGTHYVAGGSTMIITSSNGTAWTEVTHGIATSMIRTVAFGNGTFVVGGNSGTLAYSTDNGATWTTVADSTFGTSQISNIAYGGGAFVVVGHSGKMAFSRDNGVTWTAVDDSAFGDTNINRVTFAGGKFIAAGNDGKIAYCTP